MRRHLVRACGQLWELDSRWAQTALGLSRHPGTLCRAYISGQRKRYMNPVSYFLLAVGVNLLVTRWATYWYPKRESAAEEGDPGDLTYWTLALLVPLAVSWSWLFRRARYNWAEHYVLGLFITGHFVLFEVCCLLPLDLLLQHETVIWTLSGFSWFGYVSWAAAKFYQEPVWRAALKMVASVLFLLVLVGLVEALRSGLTSGLLEEV